MSLTQWVATQGLDALSFDTGSTLWLGFHTGVPTTGNELTTGGGITYARTQVAFAEGNGGGGDDFYWTNSVTSGPIDIPAQTATYIGLWTASTSGTLVAQKPFSYVGPGIVGFDAADLIVTCLSVLS